MRQTHKTIIHIERIAKLLDNQFKIGPFRFGLDPLIGLFPGIGDFIPVAFSLYLLHLAHKENIATHVKHKMIANIVVDVIIGSIPIAGDIGDFFFKASERNVELLKAELKKTLKNDAKIIEGEIIE